MAEKGTWYPSMVANLRIRFDETFQTLEIPEPDLQSGIEGASAAPSQQPQPRPLIIQKGIHTNIANRVPRSAKIELPGLRQAGTFDLEFDWRELPIDPRLMRSIAVEIYLGELTPIEGLFAPLFLDVPIDRC